MTLKSITLLSEDEYVKYKKLIPCLQDAWWLKTPASDDEYRVRVVFTPDMVCDMHYKLSNAIRPCCIFELDANDPAYWKKFDSLVGSKIKYGQYTWTILDIVSGNLVTLCDTFVLEDSFDIKSNAWETSELKAWLETKFINSITI